LDSIWSKLNPWVVALDPNLHVESSNHELSFFKAFFCFLFFVFFLGGSIQLIFLPKWCHVDLALICHVLVWDPHLKAMGPIYGSHPIRSLYFVGPKDLGSSSKVALSHSRYTYIMWLYGPSFARNHYFVGHTSDAIGCMERSVFGLK